MKLRIKLIVLLGISILGIAFYLLLVEDILIHYPDQPLTMKSTTNVLDDAPNYIHYINNAMVTSHVISTGMYADADYQNFQVIIEIPADDPLLMEAWSDNFASVYLESFLQKTTEWISNNYYTIGIYYYNDTLYLTPTYITRERWAGLDRRVSTIIPLPQDAKNKSIYVEYASDLGSFLTLTNGNDIRFYNNYLSFY